MNRRAILSIIFPVLGLSAVAGTGFAAWYFESATDDTKTLNGTVKVEDQFEGTLALDDTPTTFEISFDQGSIADKADVTKGITFKKADSNGKSELTAIKAKYSLTSDQAGVFKKSNLKFTLSAEFAFDAKLLEYVDVQTTAFLPASPNAFTLTSPTGTPSDNKYTISKTVAPTDISDTDAASGKDWTFGVNTSSNTFLHYKTNKKPQTKDEYNTMVTDLSNKTLKVTFKVVVADNV